MKCWIRRYDSKEEIWKDTWFAKHLWGTQNHWVATREDAKSFDTIKEAKWYISFYKLKNCEVEK